MDLRLGFLASHGGSNVDAILGSIANKSLDADPRIVICNNPDARVLEIARGNDIPCSCLNSRDYGEFSCLDDAIVGVLRGRDVNLVVLAGYMKHVGDKVRDAYPNRIVNIHPALLPKYGGEGMYGHHVHEAVLASDNTESGATVHLVTSEYDSGRILGQVKVPRYPGDDVDSLSSRVLRFEHVIYSQVLRDIKNGLINLDK